MTVRHRVLADADAVQARVAAMGNELAARHPDGCVLVGVLKGSVIVLADLVRAMCVSTRVDFVAVSSYRPGAGRVRLLKDLDLDVTGAPVVLVQDVVHTGLTAAFLTRELARRGASSVEVCALVDRRARRIVPVEVRTAGFVVDDEYVIGMGLDRLGLYRNLRSLVAVDEAALAADPDALVGDLYRDRARGVGGGRGSRQRR
ncbi:MAG TPA: phosphoribosyltransferase family protein [Acidimicrobiales bacterium]